MSAHLSQFPIVVVGGGFFGAVIAHRAASELGVPVVVLERRTHIGGNAYSTQDPQTSIEYHTYGSHLFHTSSAKIWDFVTRFGAFNNYRHRVVARHGCAFYTLPINLMTISAIFGRPHSPTEARTRLAEEAAREGISHPRNLEEKALSLMGRRLYDAFIRGYTQKQWGTDPRELPPHIITRLPIRFSFNDSYFDDTYQGVPVDGYDALFKRLLDHPLIECRTSCEFTDARAHIAKEALIVYTGPIDRLFEYRFGILGWRTLDFQLERLDIDDYQGAAVVNYVDVEDAFTRIHEFKHLHPERRVHHKTLIMREYSRVACRHDEPYYPIGTEADRSRLAQYQLLAKREPRLILGGRLASYRYLDMDQAIGAALKCFDEDVAPSITGHGRRPRSQHTGPA